MIKIYVINKISSYIDKNGIYHELTNDGILPAIYLKKNAAITAMLNQRTIYVEKFGLNIENDNEIDLANDSRAIDYFEVVDDTAKIRTRCTLYETFTND